MFIGTYQNMYPFDKMPQGNGLSTDPLTDPLLSDILQEGQDESETRDEWIETCTEETVRREHVGRHQQSEEEHAYCGEAEKCFCDSRSSKSAGGNKKGGSPQKGKSIKDYSSEDIFRRSLGGADRSGPVNRVLTKSASSSLNTPGTC